MGNAAPQGVDDKPVRLFYAPCYWLAASPHPGCESHNQTENWLFRLIAQS